MQALKDVLGRAEEQRNLKSLMWCTLLVVGLVTIVFGASEFRFLFSPDHTSDDGTSIEDSSALQADQGGG
jgi:hypothetical protein